VGKESEGAKRRGKRESAGKKMAGDGREGEFGKKILVFWVLVLGEIIVGFIFFEYFYCLKNACLFERGF
jgi:hypothetical protein